MNKNSFLLYKLYEQGFPVEDIYETKVKCIPTRRFSDLNDLKTPELVLDNPTEKLSFIDKLNSISGVESQMMTEESNPESILHHLDEPSFMNFDPDASYDNFEVKKPDTPKVPKTIKVLDFVKLDKYKEKQ
jgi:hypothetical protein